MVKESGGMRVLCTLHFKGNKRYEKGIKRNQTGDKAWLIYKAGQCI